jgi:hypothetical protein
VRSDSNCIIQILQQGGPLLKCFDSILNGFNVDLIFLVLEVLEIMCNSSDSARDIISESTTLFQMLPEFIHGARLNEE